MEARIQAENEERGERDLQTVAFEAVINPPETAAAVQLASWAPVQGALGEGLRQQAIISGETTLSPSACVRMHRRDAGVRYVPPPALQAVAEYFKDDRGHPTAVKTFQLNKRGPLTMMPAVDPGIFVKEPGKC